MRGFHMESVYTNIDQNCNKPLVSVVVPIYNVEATLNECLLDIEAQTLTELQIICVIDGSTDGSAQIVRDHAQRDPRIEVIEKPNEGYGASCNRGIALAQGEWVAIVEPDDTLEPNMYRDLVAYADKLGGPDAVDVVKAPYWRILEDEDGTVTKVACPYKGRVHPRRQPFSVGDAQELLRHHPSIWSAIYRRAYLAEKDIRFVEAPGAGWTDNPFLVDSLCQTDRIAYLDVPHYCYHERDLNEASAFARRSPLTPLTRWNEMQDAAERAGVTDGRVLAALALRCLNYALITIDAVGADAPGVRELVERSFDRLDPSLVLGDARMPARGQRLFAQVRGLPEPKPHRLAHMANLVGEGIHRVRINGFGFTVRTARERLGK